MSSLARRIAIALMEKRGVERDPSRPRYRDGKIVGFCWPLPSARQLSDPPKDKPLPRGRRRGKRNSAYIARRKALQA